MSQKWDYFLTSNIKSPGTNIRLNNRVGPSLIRGQQTGFILFDSEIHVFIITTLENLLIITLRYFHTQHCHVLIELQNMKALCPRTKKKRYMYVTKFVFYMKTLYWQSCFNQEIDSCWPHLKSKISDTK